MDLSGLGNKYLGCTVTVDESEIVYGEVSSLCMFNFIALLYRRQEYIRESI